MTISAYVGLPGSGKTYSVVEHVIIPALSRDCRHIWTNIPMRGLRPEWEIFLHKFATIDDLDELVRSGDYAGGVVIVDEPWRYWPAGTKSNDLSERHRSFFAEHRHAVNDEGLSTDIVLVTQDLSQVASFMRALVDKTYLHKKMDVVGLKNSFSVNIYSGAVTGSAPSEKRKVGSAKGRYKSAIYQYYLSHTKSSSGEAGMEIHQDNRANLWRRPLFYLGIPVALLAFVYGVFHIYRMASGELPGTATAGGEKSMAGDRGAGSLNVPRETKPTNVPRETKPTNVARRVQQGTVYKPVRYKDSSYESMEYVGRVGDMAILQGPKTYRMISYERNCYTLDLETVCQQGRYIFRERRSVANVAPEYLRVYGGQRVGGAGSERSVIASAPDADSQKGESSKSVK